MGMPVRVILADAHASQEDIDRVFHYLTSIDETFSTYKPHSEISRINRGEIQDTDYSSDMARIFALADDTKRATNGYFDIQTPGGALDPSGIVKGWAVNEAATLLRSLGYSHFYVEIGGDIQTAGEAAAGKPWSIGIRNPFKIDEIVKVVYPKNRGIATSGTYVRGNHIYDPNTGTPVETDLVSLTVIGDDVYEADRFATAAFAMGTRAVPFIEQKEGLEAYAIDRNGVATMTSGFEAYTRI